MSRIVCFLGAVSHCDEQFAYGKFVRDDGRIVEDLKMPLSAFNIKPPAATVIIAKARVSDSFIPSLDLKFRTATLEEVKFLDRVEMAEAMQWIRETQI